MPWDGRRKLTLTDLVRYAASERVPWDTVIGLTNQPLNQPGRLAMMDEAGAVIMASGMLTVVAYNVVVPALHRNHDHREW